MNKPITLIACLIFLLFWNIAFAQDELTLALAKDSKKDTKTINILSLDGKNRKVHIMPDYANHILRISCLKDTITDYDFWGVPVEARILNKGFIEIKYAVRGGSNVGRGNILLLCISGDKLYEAMHAERLLSGEYEDEQERYDIKIAALVGDNKKAYKLIVTIHDFVKSKANPETDYDYRNQSILRFDESRHVFYSVKADLFNYFINIYNPKTSKLMHKQKIDGNFPVIILGKETYYFIKDEWYQLNDNNELDKYEITTTK